MTNKLSLTIGIPAYNEEGNIRKALKSVFLQKGSNYGLQKIVVISDGSNDDTVEVAKCVKYSKLTVVEGKKRKGKAFRLNQIFRLSKSDVLVLLDADCQLQKNALTNIVKHFKKDKDCVLVGGNASPEKPTGFIEKTVYVGVKIKKHVTDPRNHPNNVYLYHGSLLGLRKKFYKKLKIPDTSGTDAYLYFKATQKHLKTAYVKNAKVQYSLPIQLRGHVKQSSRFLSSQEAMEKHFGRKVISEYKISKVILLAELIKQFAKEPVYTSLYLFINSIIKVRNLFISKQSSGIWEIALSSKGGRE